jgi:hypothetical protein
VHADTNATTTETFNASTAAITSTTISSATACKAKSIKIKITKVYKHTGYQKDISAMS